jgi:diguanylate cyclase (GGDEF)-like protein
VPPSDPSELYDENADDERTATIDVRAFGPRRSVRDRHLLVRLQGAQAGQVLNVSGAEWRVGRARQAELFIDDSGVSRNHAHLLWEGEGYVLEDLGSSNGTYVNGERVTRRTLRDGDTVQFGSTALFRYALADAEQEAMLQHLYNASVTDPLTSVYNREHFERRLEAELSFARRHHTELALLIFDLDHFKRVNDTYGHPTGDRVLIAFAQRIAQHIRAEDVFARYGGEEFVVLLRGIDLPRAHQAAERIRASVEALEVPAVIRNEQRLIRITVSIGVAAIEDASADSDTSLVAAADRRLYAAKHLGRNRVVAHG